ncbi:MAG: 50S ribosomal protein L5 [Opitutales bacterium]
MEQPSLKQHYADTVVPALMEKFGHSNRHEVPAINKIVINSGFSATADKNHIAYVADEIAKIAGQRPVTTKAKLSISNFKLRTGQPIGVKVTLRGKAMYEFLTRLIFIALPCMRDFRGVPTTMDGNGNYTLGVADHAIFPEISAEGTNETIGMDICINTTARTDEEGRELLRLLGFPFRKPGASAETTAEVVETATASA